MPCKIVKDAVIYSASGYGRLHVGNEYIYVDYHEHTGPAFYCDKAMTKLYPLADENDPIWPVFEVWLEKRYARLRKRAVEKETNNGK